MNIKAVHNPRVVTVGSTNPVKLQAVQASFSAYFPKEDFHFQDRAAVSGVEAQPFSLDEIIQGAKNRAQLAVQASDFGVGLEGGLFPCASSNSGYFEITACAIYDGQRFAVGLSSAFEHPQAVIDLVRQRGVTISTAYYLAGLTTNTCIGAAEGAIGLLSQGRLTRNEYSQQAVFCALVAYAGRPSSTVLE